MQLFKKYMYLIPLGIQIGALLYSLYVINTSNIAFGNKQYAGSVYVIASVYLLSTGRKKWSVYLTGASLLIGA